MTTKKLTLRQKILVAGTLFGMFFGAGNLILPVHLGQMAGQNALPAPGAAISAVEPVEAYRSDAFFPARIEDYADQERRKK